MVEFVQLLSSGLVTGSILAMAAVGVSLVYGVEITDASIMMTPTSKRRI